MRSHDSSSGNQAKWIGWAAAGLVVVSALTIPMAGPSHAADCPPERPLCRLFRTTTPTTSPAPAGLVTVPSVPPVTVPPPPPPPPSPPAAPRPAPEAAQRLLDLVNGERARSGLSRLTSRHDVVAIALVHSQRMVASGTIFHNDSYFSDSVQRLLNSKARGENVAQNSSVDDTHTRLMNSPGHRANILDPRFTVAGFAVVQASDGRYYTTQNFMQPAGPAASPALRPPAAPAAPRLAVAAGVPAAVAAPAPAIPPSAPTPVTVTEDPALPAADQATLAGLAVGRRSPAASAGPDLARRRLPASWLPAGVLLTLVAMGLVQAGRRTERGGASGR